MNGGQRLNGVSVEETIQLVNIIILMFGSRTGLVLSIIQIWMSMPLLFLLLLLLVNHIVKHKHIDL